MKQAKSGVEGWSQVETIEQPRLIDCSIQVANDSLFVQTLRAEAGCGLRTSLYYDVARIYSYTQIQAFDSRQHRFDTYRNVYICASSTVIQREKQRCALK